MAELGLGKSQTAVMRTNDRSGLIIRSPMYNILIDATSAALPDNFRPDIIMVTHEHSHHLDENFIFSLYKAMKSNAGSAQQKPYGVSPPEDLPPIVADQTSAVLLRRFINRDLIKVMTPGDELPIDMITIEAFSSDHPTAMTPLTYVIILDNGLRVYHASDSLPNDDMKAVSEREPDIAFVPIGLDPGVSPMSGAQIAGIVQPDTVVPFHGSDLNKFKSSLKKLHKKIQVKTMAPGEMQVYG
jgi:L-ascorbate metabolism protein UlaG (beta-lactamase superfamily)